MTELEALGEARLAVHSQVLSHKAPAVHEHWLLVRTQLEILIEQVKMAEADPNYAADVAQSVMAENGRIVTQWVSRKWVERYMESANRKPDADELAGVILRLRDCDVLIDSGVAVGDEPSQVVIDKWMAENWAESWGD